jgi:4-amino-4-deoxychorismate lyase
VIQLLNGSATDKLQLSDRGLAYGDGLFETLLVADAIPQLWHLHMQRLTRGLQQLHLVDSQIVLDSLLNKVREDVEKALASNILRGPAVLKLIITRGQGGRGYLAPNRPKYNRIVSLIPLPLQRAKLSCSGITARLCRQQLGSNPALAGHKHLNRLEQVLARNEWQDEDIHEGLMTNLDGDLVAGVMSNLFIEQDGILLTSPVARCGIAGVMRQQLMDVANSSNIALRQQRLVIADLNDADSVWLTNSLNGIWPVKYLLDVDHRLLNEYTISPLTRVMQQTLAATLETSLMLSQWQL